MQEYCLVKQRDIETSEIQRHGLRGYLTEVLKWSKGYNEEDISKILTVNNQDRTTNNGFKLEKFRIRKKIGRKWLSNRAANEWNRLLSR